MVVSNSTPFICLSRIKSLHLLKSLYKKVFISETVYQELVISGRGKIGAIEIKEANWIVRKRVRDNLAVESLQTELDMGEAETIILARESNADLIIMDEEKGRRIAKNLGLCVIGTIGVLLKAKRERIIENVKPSLNKLRESGFWIDKNLYRIILEEEGE